jgi:threonine/homoserine/homoserine lactone efflux protein
LLPVLQAMSELIAFAGVIALASVSPGPNVILVVDHNLSFGIGRIAPTIFGNISRVHFGYALTASTIQGRIGDRRFRCAAQVGSGVAMPGFGVAMAASVWRRSCVAGSTRLRGRVRPARGSA